mgnify:CR=1 FL=1
MADLQETLTLLETKVKALVDSEIARLEQERDFLKSVRDKSLGGATVKDNSAKESDVIADVQALLGLG